MAREVSLPEAITEFPVVIWLQEHVKVYDSGGDNFYADCPMCSGQRKLGVNRYFKLFHCFKCDEGGSGDGRWPGKPGRANLVQFIVAVRRCSKAAAIKEIFQRSGFPDSAVQRPVAPARTIPEEAVPLVKAPWDHPSVLMMHRRHASHLIPESYVCVDGKYEGRVILPCKFQGKRTGFEAKAYDKWKKPKALYPSWFEAASNLYTTAWDPECDYAIVTESIMDAETFGVNAVGLYGSSLSDGQLGLLILLRKQGVKRLIWALDNDAWRKQFKAMVAKTGSFFENWTVKLDGKDPNDCGPEVCRALLENLWPFQDEFDWLELSMAWGRSL